MARPAGGSRPHLSLLPPAIDIEGGLNTSLWDSDGTVSSLVNPSPSLDASLYGLPGVSAGRRMPLASTLRRGGSTTRD